jgi:hypothetical protein
MASVSAFNDMLDQFLVELKETFPEEPSFKKYYNSFDLMRGVNPKKCVEVFMQEITPYAQQIMTKDESVFQKLELDIKKHWTPDLSSATKDAIWQYLQTLNILGMTITAIPPEMMTAVEGLAQKLSSGMQETGNLDMSSMMSGVTGLLGGMLNK